MKKTFRCVIVIAGATIALTCCRTKETSMRTMRQNTAKEALSVRTMHIDSCTSLLVVAIDSPTFTLAHDSSPTFTMRAREIHAAAVCRKSQTASTETADSTIGETSVVLEKAASESDTSRWPRMLLTTAALCVILLSWLRIRLRL